MSTTNRIWVAVTTALLALLAGCGAAGATSPLGSAPPASPPIVVEAAGSTAVVVKVTDGDTVKLDNGQTIRVLGIDTPETKKPRTPVQCWGPEATAFAQAQLLGKRVTVTSDPSQDDVDRYGRQLRALRLPDGRDYATAAGEAGAARIYVYERKPVLNAPALLAAQVRAQAARAGLWGACPA